ncbi:MAG: ABC transporter substrate-binding protein [Burkholderiaceae bacterium]|nr:ABC transporter substrate-binding protein [Burkholderiaceae bacterium]MBP6651182.1 ABC transporter substrate-binding protein [Xylophilus sp.]MBP6616669.1 ABC transporter substrate-binding protein [Burkholderiaceae bacterium]MBP7420019.1 ABC transporter substrate-binding protein [Burkholderiaceae bacterium]MBP8150600.1 ABC transporter substrate-binding protein [Xylophilus sp.]
MDTSKRKLLGAAVATGMLASVAPRRVWSAPSGRPLIVGQSVPLTGAASEIGLAYAGGAKLYLSNFNSRADSPVRIEVRQLDDGYSGERAAANATKLLAEGAELLFGFVGTASSAAGAAVAKQQGAVFLAPFAAPDSLREPSQGHVFMVRPSMANEAFKMVQHCATLGLTRIAVVGEDDAMGRAGLEAVNKAIVELKLPPLAASAFMPSNSRQVGAAVATIKAAQPQAIIQAALFQSTAAFIQQMRKTGYIGTFLNFSAVGINPLYTALGNDIGGVVVAQVVPPPRSMSVPVVREYTAAIENSDESPSYESLEGFIAAKVLAEAVRRGGRGPELQKTLTAMRSYDVGGLWLNLRARPRENMASIDLISITADGRTIR